MVLMIVHVSVHIVVGYNRGIPILICENICKVVKKKCKLFKKFKQGKQRCFRGLKHCVFQKLFGQIIP